MSRKILSLAGLYLLPKRGQTPRFHAGIETPNVGGEGSDPARTCDGTVPVEDVRAVATEGALATAVDASPAVLVSLWAHDQRLHPGKDRCPPRRGS